MSLLASLSSGLWNDSLDVVKSVLSQRALIYWAAQIICDEKNILSTKMFNSVSKCSEILPAHSDSYHDGYLAVVSRQGTH